MSGQLCLRWNNHATAFNKLLKKIYLEDIYSDGTILCQGKFYSVHSFVLSTCSEYFEEMFSQCARLKNKQPYIVVKDIHPEQMEALLNYMYKGEVNVPQDMLPELIKAAEVFKIKGLAVPDEEPPKHSRKRTNLSSPPSVPKKSRKIEDKSLIINRSRLEISEHKSTENIDSNSDSLSTSQLYQNISKSTDEVETPESLIPKIKEEPTEKQEAVFVLDDNGEAAAFPVKVEQNYQSYEDNDTNIEPFDYDASNDNFDASSDNFDASNDNFDGAQESVSWDNSQPFEGGEGSENDPTQRLFGDGPDDPSRDQDRWKELASSITCPFIGCTYTSIHKGNMKRHIQNHTGQKPFKCPVCPYRSAQKNNIGIHFNNVHSADKPFSCPSCHYSTAIKGNLKTHMVNQHGFKRSLSILDPLPPIIDVAPPLMDIQPPIMDIPPPIMNIATPIMDDGNNSNIGQN